jgi:hypothetical protein
MASCPFVHDAMSTSNTKITDTTTYHHTTTTIIENKIEKTIANTI